MAVWKGVKTSDFILLKISLNYVNLTVLPSIDFTVQASIINLSIISRFMSIILELANSNLVI
jgi:hypothetical protein